jgi:alkanesulfonate monooxygenase SsuD/methylene tetrahydromethanopterin reductase-like flavin-dependent oxidoreductase (luciferase family)
MRFGLYLPNQGPFADAAVLASLAHEAETAGWDGFFLWDELIPVYSEVERLRADADRGIDWSPVIDPFIALTAVAANTERIRFGGLVSALPRLRPEIFASQTATLDRFSEGRLIVGVGLGSPSEQLAIFGFETDLRKRAAMVDEFLDLLTQLWSGRRIDFRGRFYQAVDFAMQPTPVQQPRIPIWVAGGATNTAPRRRAARWDGFAPVSDDWPEDVITPDDYRGIAEDIGNRRATDGLFDLVVFGDADGRKPAPDSLDDYASAGVTWVVAQAFSLGDAHDRIATGLPTPS